MKRLAFLVCCSVVALAASPVFAKLPALGDEAKAKAAEAAAKTGHGNKLAAYQLCRSMDKVALAYFAQAKKDGKAVKPADKTDACADPGVFVYTPPAPAAAPAPAPAVVAGAAPAAPGLSTTPAALPKK